MFSGGHSSHTWHEGHAAPPERSTNDLHIQKSKKSLKAKEARCAKKRRLYKLHADKPVKTNVNVKNDSMPIPEHAYCKVIRKNAK